MFSIFKNMSKVRTRYAIRLLFRCIVFAVCFAVWLVLPQTYDILQGWNFFKTLSPLHILWVIWVIDMIEQLLPIKSHIALGSTKLWKFSFRPAPQSHNAQALKQYISSSNKYALWVLVLWVALIAAIGAVRFTGLIDDNLLFLCTVAFYVFDLVCVLIWCPFRLIMRAKCCTTCRIFNWDHMMMFSPMLFVKGFYGWSLLAIGLAALAVWEVFILLHPERFWFGSNEALTCANCTDKLCTQYCRKLRK